MNLLQLQARVNEIVADNEARFPAEKRNEKTLIIELPHRTPKNRRGKSEYREIDYISGAIYGLGHHGLFSHIVAKDTGFKLSDSKLY